ncbi:MAG: hypothetical protein II851_04320 [Bacteroidales bacterium]|nr:hypothetical protein [Bacteroidales bacterium]
MRHLPLLIAIVLLLTSCSATYRARTLESDTLSYINMTHEELVDLLGAPLREVNDGGEGYILVFSGDSVSSTRPKQNGASAPEIKCFMDKNGYCYDVLTSNTQSRAVSTAKNIGMIILLGILICL